ncbi:MAG TPA: 50S ribosomal protein L11 methyltransferase [Actinomycetota bacterium]
MDHDESREYVWRGRGGPFRLILGEHTFAPTHTSMEVAESLVVNPGDRVIDVGCGSGVLSFVAARLGASKVHGTELNPEGVRFAQENAERLGMDGVVQIHHGSLFEPLKGLQAEVVIGDVSGIPDEIARLSGWFPGGYSGGPTGAEVPMAMLEQAADHLAPGGRLYLPTASIQDERAVLRTARRIFGDGRMRQLRERLLPLPGKLAESNVVRRLRESGVVNLIRRGSRQLWRLRVWEVQSPR